MKQAFYNSELLSKLWSDVSTKITGALSLSRAGHPHKILCPSALEPIKRMSLLLVLVQPFLSLAKGSSLAGACLQAVSVALSRTRRLLSLCSTLLLPPLQQTTLPGTHSGVAPYQPILSTLQRTPTQLELECKFPLSPATDSTSSSQERPEAPPSPQEQSRPGYTSPSHETRQNESQRAKRSLPEGLEEKARPGRVQTNLPLQDRFSF